MVFRGKPSRACLRCRTRKLRCDVRQSSCGPCTRAGVACSGYRDPEKLQIRDESQSTKQKALIRGPKIVPRPLSISINDRARAAFFAHYVKFSSTYEVLETLYASSPSGGHLAVSVDAVSLTFFSLQHNLDLAPLVVREKYLVALPLLSKALNTPEDATSDATLLSVLLLDLFEKISRKTPSVSSSWMSHASGALALIKLRNKKHLSDYTLLRLSVRLSTNLIITCVAANAPVPADVLKLRSDIEPFIDKNDPKWRLTGLVAKYASLTGGICDSQLHNATIITDALKLDREFISLANSMPSTWHYKTSYLEKASDAVFDMRSDFYPDQHKTLTWNVLRVMRILLNDMVRANCTIRATIPCKGTPASVTAEVATKIVDTMASDICASVLQYNGYWNNSTKRKRVSVGPPFRCYSLLYPLYVAGMYASPSTGIKTWIIKQTRLMVNECDVRNAGVVADILEKGEGTSPWSVYAILGSYAFAS